MKICRKAVDGRKKKLLALLLTLALIFASAVPASAAFAAVWRLENAGLTLALPSGWEVLTPDMDKGDIAYTAITFSSPSLL